MKVHVLSKIADRVKVKSLIGTFEAKWCTESPVVSGQYFVELGSKEELTHDSIIKVNMWRGAEVRSENNEVYLTGFAEDIEDGVLFLRLGESLMMVNLSSGQNFDEFKEKYVSIKLKELNLYDIHI